MTRAPDAGPAKPQAGHPAAAVPAGTVIVLRDGAAGLEVLMLRRATTLAFAAGNWVFPGGRVEPGDLAAAPLGPGGYLGEQGAARRAAAREAAEEAGIALDSASLVPLSHWLPPSTAPRRFSTWIFLASAEPGTAVAVDGGEITAHVWAHPSDVLIRRDAGEIALLPPTWVSLWHVARYQSADAALEAARRSVPSVFRPRMITIDGTTVSVYAEDAGYGGTASAADGPRHRLVLDPAGWRYERAFGPPPR
jgi:8-oxo-dGTP pyrophosphatase MutT (NUDIX family)